jgi:hypothetical protein
MGIRERWEMERKNRCIVLQDTGFCTFYVLFDWENRVTEYEKRLKKGKDMNTFEREWP